jgi:dehydrogenase/reductase SDR family member 7B
MHFFLGGSQRLRRQWYTGTLLLLSILIPTVVSFTDHLRSPVRRSSLGQSNKSLLPVSSLRIFALSGTRLNMGQSSSVLQQRTRDEFRGRHVLITGASSGLGRALALQLASCSVATLILSARNAEALQKVAQECQALESNLVIHILVCDLSKPDQVAALATQALDKCPNIDILVNNGGISSRSSFLETELAVDQTLMQVNFFAGAALAKALVPRMISSANNRSIRGRIIWISSVQGLMGIPLRSSYAASKFAVQGYTECLRAELAAQHITVHTVSPGYIRTNLSKSALTGDGRLHNQMDATTAAGQDPQQVATNVLNAVSRNRADILVAATPSALIALWLRFLFPTLLQAQLRKRYLKATAASETSNKKED